MNLHMDHESFSVLLNSTVEKTGIRADIVEKDYYLTLLRFELAEKQDGLSKILLERRAVCKEELNNLINMLLTQVVPNDRKKVENVIRSELHHYV